MAAQRGPQRSALVLALAPALVLLRVALPGHSAAFASGGAVRLSARPAALGRGRGVARRSKAELEVKLRTWVSKASSLGLDPVVMLPGLKDNFLQGLPEIVTDQEFDEVAEAVLSGAPVPSPLPAPATIEQAAVPPTAPLSATAAALAPPTEAAPVAKVSPVALGGPTPLEEGGAASVPLYWASAAFFGPEQLEPSGARDDADKGSPACASRELYDDGEVSVGTWTCTEGGFPVVSRGSSEWFHVLEGEGILTDSDDVPHVFRKGDTVVLPKGWSGRWDILKPVHKIWVVQEHGEDLDAADSQRAIVGPVNELASWENYEPLGKRKADWGEPEHFSHKLWAGGPLSAGSWACTEGGFLGSPNRPTTEVFYVLEGLVFMTGLDGIARRITAGDTVILPKGWSGRWDVVKPIRKVWAVMK